MHADALVSQIILFCSEIATLVPSIQQHDEYRAWRTQLWQLLGLVLYTAAVDDDIFALHDPSSSLAVPFVEICNTVRRAVHLSPIPPPVLISDSSVFKQQWNNATYLSVQSLRVADMCTKFNLLEILPNGRCWYTAFAYLEWITSNRSRSVLLTSPISPSRVDYIASNAAEQLIKLLDAHGRLFPFISDTEHDLKCPCAFMLPAFQVQLDYIGSNKHNLVSTTNWWKFDLLVGPMRNMLLSIIRGEIDDANGARHGAKGDMLLIVLLQCGNVGDVSVLSENSDTTTEVNVLRLPRRDLNHQAMNIVVFRHAGSSVTGHGDHISLLIPTGILNESVSALQLTSPAVLIKSQTQLMVL